MNFPILDASITYLFNIGLDLFAAAVIFIIRLNSNRITENSYGERLFRLILVADIFLLIADSFTWLLNGKPGNIVRFFSTLSSMLFFLVYPVVIITWVKYAWYRIYKQTFTKTADILFCVIPYVIFAITTVSSPWLKLMFYLDDANIYHRGILNNPFSILFLVYLLFTSVIAIRKNRRAILYSEKKEYRTISSFIVAPLIGGIIQTSMYGCSLTWPFTAFSILLVYLNQKTQDISQDSLTKLNNRATLDKHLHYLFSDSKEKFGLILFDVNSFKSINDTYGHLNGDNALSKLAAIMKMTFGETDSFLARYGGDEFVAIIKNSTEESLKSYIVDINNALDVFNTSKTIPFKLSVSSGYCMYPSEGIHTIKELIEKADVQMYENKKAYHKSISN